MRIEDLSSQQIKLLTNILQLQPSEDAISYSNRTLELMRSLPSELKRPSRFSRLIIPSKTNWAPLCALHKQLHAYYVHSLFTLIALEVGVRLNSLISHGERLSTEQYLCVQRLRELHVLWLDPEIYRKTFLVSAHEVSRWRYQADKCEACIISRIAGHLEILLDLRRTLLSRTRTKFVEQYGEPRLKPWIATWIKNLKRHVQRQTMRDEDFEHLISQNDQDALELKKVRKQISKEKKRRRRGTGDEKGSRRIERETAIELPAEESPDADFEPLPMSPRFHPDMERSRHDGGGDYDAELEIVDHYAALLSTPHLPQLSQVSFQQSRNHVRSTMENRLSSVSDSPGTASAGFDSRRTHPYIHKAPKAMYSESVYSVDTIRNNDRVVTRHAKPSTSRRPTPIPELEDTELKTDYDSERSRRTKDPPAPLHQQQVSNQNQEEQVKLYQDLFTMLERDSSSNSSGSTLRTPELFPDSLSTRSNRDSWGDESVAPTLPSGTQLALQLKESMGISDDRDSRIEAYYAQRDNYTKRRDSEVTLHSSHPAYRSNPFPYPLQDNPDPAVTSTHQITNNRDTTATDETRWSNLYKNDFAQREEYAWFVQRREQEREKEKQQKAAKVEGDWYSQKVEREESKEKKGKAKKTKKFGFL